MTWRVIVISKRAKLETKLNYLVVRSDLTQKVFLGEISTLIIESTAVSITAALMCELVKRKIKVFFCDEKRNPAFELSPFYGSHDTTEKIRRQINWCPIIKDKIWTLIVKNKIKQQETILLNHKLNKEAQMLEGYEKEVETRDITNREGHAAKVYFNALFGTSFTRSRLCVENTALNYGYAILLSLFNREITSNGYLTQIGIFHDNIFNKFNLASDLMEPYRPLVDEMVITGNFKKFDTHEKRIIQNLINKEVIVDNKKHFLNNAVRLYCKSIFDALDLERIEEIKFYKNEL